jgi:hypothetical protein
VEAGGDPGCGTGDPRVPRRVEQQGHARHEVQRAPSNLRSSPYLSRFSTINRKLVTNCTHTGAIITYNVVSYVSIYLSIYLSS